MVVVNANPEDGRGGAIFLIIRVSAKASAVNPCWSPTCSRHILVPTNLLPPNAAFPPYRSGLLKT